MYSVENIVKGGVFFVDEKEWLIETRGMLSFLEQTLGECESNDHLYWIIS